MTQEAKPADPAQAAVFQPTPGDIEQFGVTAPLEIAAILQAIAKNNDFISVYFNDNQDYFLTTLLDVNRSMGKIFLDLGANQIMNRRAAAAAPITCVTNNGKVRVRFELPQLETTSHESRPAFQAALPDLVLRYQRRAYFRLQLPVTQQVQMKINVRQKNGAPATVDAKLNDISIGGVNLSLAVEAWDPAIGDEVSVAQLNLPEVGSLNPALVVRNREDRKLQNGTSIRRVGCEFQKLSGAEEVLVQRYILVASRGPAARKAALRR